MQRPEFDAIRDYDEFCKYYWYREELIQICRAHGLKADGSKIELNNVIKAYFSGEKILPEKKKNRTKKSFSSELTLDTGLIECGFTFGNRFRDFFSEQTGVKPFKFNVDMVATAKAVKETGDESFTLGDLLDIYYGKKTYAKYDKSALQWNKFVHDFCEDDCTKVFSNRLKAAAALWKIIRESDLPKEYSHDLLERYRDMMDKQKEILLTKRLLLRHWNMNDAENLFKYASDPDVGPIAGWPVHQNIEESKAVIRDVFNGAECYAICLREDEKAIGAIELKLNGHTDLTDRDDECEMGYWLGKPFWGQGIMPEAVNELLRHAFEDCGMQKVWIGYYEGNYKSKRVQEKCGFNYQWKSENVDVPLLGEKRTGHVSLMTKEDWESRK